MAKDLHTHKVRFSFWIHDFCTSDLERYSRFLSEGIDDAGSFQVYAEGDPDSRSMLVDRDEERGFRVVFVREYSEFDLLSEDGITGDLVLDVMSGNQDLVDSGTYLTKSATVQAIRFFVDHLDMDPTYVWVVHKQIPR